MTKPSLRNKAIKWTGFVLAAAFCLTAAAQDIPIDHQKFTYFPYSPQRTWTTSIGITATTMPYEITEELHYRIPALDVHILTKLGKHLHLDTRASIQAIQNQITMGPRWAKKLTHRTSVAIGDDVGYWFGFVNVEGFRIKGMGWQNFPNLSVGYRFNKQILFTFRADALMTLNINTHAGTIPVTTNYRLFSGSSYTVALEQPFYGNKTLTLGFRAMYTKFFWQTWSAFNNFDRNFFYPQLIVGLVL